MSRSREGCWAYGVVNRRKTAIILRMVAASVTEQGRAEKWRKEPDLVRTVQYRPKKHPCVHHLKCPASPILAQSAPESRADPGPDDPAQMGCSTPCLRVSFKPHWLRWRDSRPRCLLKLCDPVSGLT